MSKEDRLAQEIINAVGGMHNIQRIMHCMTRVRLSIKNPDIVNYDELHQIEGVIGIVEDETLQIIVGPGVVEKVAGHMADYSHVPLGEDISYSDNQSYQSQAKALAKENKKHYQKSRKQSKWQRFLKSISNIFIPLIPAFIGAGLIGGIAAVLNNMLTAHMISGDFMKQLVTILNVIKDGMLAYLAIFTGINSAKVFGATPGLGGVIGGTTLLTGLTDENPIQNIFTGEPLVAGQGGIIGVIFAVWILSIIEKKLHKVTPNAIDIIVTPTLSLLGVGLLTIFIIMPIAGFVSCLLYTSPSPRD